MQLRVTSIGFVVAAVCMLAFAGIAGDVRAASGGVVTNSDLRQAVAASADADAAARAQVQTFLARPEVARVAGDAGLNIARARDAAGAMSGPGARIVAGRIARANLVSGSDTIVLNSTTLIIILLIIIVIILIAR